MNADADGDAGAKTICLDLTCKK